MAGFRPPFHFGGPMGLAGLTMLAGATGLFVLAGSPPEEAGSAVALSGVAMERTEPRPDERVDRGPALVTPAPPAAVTLPDMPVEPIVRPEQALPNVITAQANGAEVTFVVRIKGSAEIDEASRSFRKDPAAAEEAYAAFVRRNPELSDFSLVGASYSGEIKLSYTMPPGQEPTRTAIRDIQDRLMSVEGVAYADPDYIAHPGKEDLK
jgi:hypothetical protein